VIKPHGADALKPLLVSDEHVKSELLAEANDLPSFVVSSAAAANLVMLGGGYFTPLSGFMNLAEALSVAETMHTPDGLFWPVPVLNLIDDVAAIEGARRIALRDSNMAGNPVLAVMEVEQIEEVTPQQIDFMAEQVFGTLDDKHPGAQVFRNLGNYCVSGDVQVLNLSYFENDFPGTRCTGLMRNCAAWQWNGWALTGS
jgi:sulfate adenylyltransferase